MALTIIYENESYYPERSIRTLNNVVHPRFYERNQTDDEKKTAKYYSRLFTTYTYFFKDYENVEQMATQFIADDKFLKTSENEAKIFKENLIKAIDEYYKTDLHFRKKRKGKTNNQILIPELLK